MLPFRFLLILMLGAPLVGQDHVIDWPNIRNNAGHHFAEATRDSSIRFIQSLPLSSVPKWQKGHEYWEFLDYFSSHLGTLREQFSMDGIMASAVAFASYSFADGFLNHELDKLLGEFSRSDPGGFLKGFRSHPQGKKLSLDYGYLLCDGFEVEKMTPDEIIRELESRIRTLETVKDEDLAPVRDECTKAIRQQIDKRIRFSRAHSAGVLSDDVLGEYLHSPFLDARRRAYDRITSRPDEYGPILQIELERWPDYLRSKATINRLLYLVALFKHRSLQPVLEEMLEEPEFEWHCLYDCPLVFAWTICSSYGGWDLPPFSPRGLTGDVYGEIFKNPVSTKKQDPRDFFTGPGVDALLNKLVKLDEIELIKLAGPSNPDADERTVAAFTLEYTVDSSRNLENLYWLAVTEIVDASAQYRSAIYHAIFRAERAKQAEKSGPAIKEREGVGVVR
jgi:hypothetical protein